MADLDADPEATTPPHGNSGQRPVREIVQELQAGLGKALVAVIANCDITTLSGWVSGTAEPSTAQEQMLRVAFQAFEVVAGADSPTAARAWFMGMNPLLDDQSPAESIAEGDLREVMAAANDFAAGN